MSKTSILIVEDEQIIAMDIRGTLEACGYTIVGQTATGADAIKKAGELHPDLIMMDIGLKGEMDGIEAATQIRAQFNLPVIFLTAFANQSTLERAREAEPYGYLLKPFDERELIIAIDMAIYKHSMEIKLRDSEARFRRPANHAPDIIFRYEIRPVMKLTYINPVVEMITGYTPDDCYADPNLMFSMIHPDDSNMMENYMQSTSLPDEHLYARWIGKDGITRWMESRLISILDTSGQMIAIEGISRDITESKKFQDVVLNSEKRLRSLIENGRDNISLLAADGTLLWESPSIIHALGYVPDQFIGRNIFELMHPDDQAWVGKMFMQIVQEPGSSQEGIFRLLHGTGLWRWIEATATNLLDDPNVQAIVINYRDITIRKQAEIEILATKNQLKATLDAIPDLMFELGLDGRYYDYHSSQADLLAIPPEIFLGKTVSETLPHDVSEIAMSALREAHEKGFSQGGQYELQLPQGTRWFELSVSRKITDPGDEPRFITLSRDITDRKLLEQSEQEQRRLAEALRDTAMALSSTLKLDDVLDRILGNIGRLVKYDVAMVSLIEGDEVCKIRYHHNSQNTSTQLQLRDIHANLINVPILKTIINTKQPFIIPDIQRDVRWQSVAIPEMKRVHSLICVPIEIYGNVVGVINVISAIPNFFTALHTERIMAFASQAAVAMENARLFEQAQQLSLTDQMTGLFNMRYFTNFGRLEFERTQRYERTISVVMVDIDYFKNINDTYGHHVGDLALHEIAARIKSAVRTVDVVARYGGEEFVILMPETGLDDARQVAERVRQIIADSSFENKDAVISVTASLGIAEIDKTTKNMEELIRYADKALYKAKANGRNRLESYSPDKSNK
jgi:diguanylate cyclase (GGDEF)-like protein/PAS domain S-box-containing protein